MKRGGPSGKFRCGRHIRGTVPGQLITFHPDCGKCLELRDAGKLTGNEPRPTYGITYGSGGTMSQNQWRLRQARLKGEALARRRAAG